MDPRRIAVSGGREADAAAARPLLGREQEAAGSRSSRSSADGGSQAVVVQFAVQIFLVEEDEPTGGNLAPHADLGIMRLGSGHRPAKVKFKTVAGSAKPGKQYVETSGEVVFAQGEYHKHIQIPMVPDDQWHATTEFKVVLSEPQGCELGQYLHTARVKVIDNSAFPTNKFMEQVRGENAKERIEELGGWSLFFQYMKLNIRQPGMLWRTLVIVLFDQLKNVNTVMRTFFLKYMVDVVFNIRDEDSEEHLIFFNTRVEEANGIAVTMVLAIAILHLWEYVKIKLDVKGLSTTFLRSNLIRKYMNYSEDSRRQVDQARLQVAMLEDTNEMAAGYEAMLDMVQIIGKVALLAWFTLHNNIRGWWVVVFMPTCMILWVTCRFWIMPAAADSVPAKQAVLHLVNEISKNYELLVNYHQRPKINDLMLQRVTKLREDEMPERLQELGNEYFPHWLGALFLGIYIYIEGQLLLGPYETRTLTLGVFLATIEVIDELGDAFEEFHDMLLMVDNSFDPLRELTYFLNLPTDLHNWKAVNRRRRELSKDRRDMYRRAVQHNEVQLNGQLLEDLIRIELQEMTFAFPLHDPIFVNCSIQAEQGMLVAISGDHGSGKTTLLHLLGHELFPTMGTIFIPGHLRIIQVSQEVMFFETWSLWDNLLFGVEKHTVNRKRVKYILEKMAMQKTLNLVKNELSPQNEVVLADPKLKRNSSVDSLDVHETKQHWHEMLSSSEKAKLCFARAFITNAEVLIMDCPLSHLGPDASDMVMETLKEHQLNRGLGLPESAVHLRRPRTCFYSVEEHKDADYADVVWVLQGTRVIEERKSI